MSATLRAQEGGRIDWRSDWRRVGVPEYVIIPTFFASAAVINFWIPPVKEALWTKPLWLDVDSRNALRIEKRSRRDFAGGISNAFAFVSIAHPALFDTIVIAKLSRDSGDVAWQMGVIDTEAYSLTVLLNTAAKRIFARQRPYALACAKDPNYTETCTDPDQFRSFYSGHSAITATSAGLLCAHHTQLPLYGGDWRDTGACLGGVAGTMATGVLRVASDRHWMSDVFVGHMVGFMAGYLLPTLIYYHQFRGLPLTARQTMQSGTQTQPIFEYSGEF